jgi:hypothetical protein
MNLNFLELSQQPSLDYYIKKSEELINSTTYYSRVNPPTPPNTIGPQTIKSKDVADKCEAELAQDKSIYMPIYNGKGKVNTEGVRDQHKYIIQKLFEGSLKNTDTYISSDYFYKLAEIDKENLNTLAKKNPKFYKINEGETNDKYNLEKGKINTFRVDSQFNNLKDNFNEVEKFLKQLKQLITTNESYTEKPDSVLVYPFQVLKINKGKGVSNQKDKNSRHYYAKAFDIAVYLLDEFSKNKKVVQIPPEIVALYVDATKNILGRKNNELGQGIFLEKTKFYNHIEFLSNDLNLSEQEINQRILYTGVIKDNKESGTDTERSIESVEEGTGRITKLKEIVQQGSNYKGDPRFKALTQ